MVLRPGEIGQGPCVTTVDTPRRDSAQWTGHAGLRRAYQEGNLRRSGVDVTGGKAQRGGIGEQAGKDVGCLCGDESGFLLKTTMSMGKRLWTHVGITIKPHKIFQNVISPKVAKNPFSMSTNAAPAVSHGRCAGALAPSGVAAA